MNDKRKYIKRKFENSNEQIPAQFVGKAPDIRNSNSINKKFKMLNKVNENSIQMASHIEDDPQRLQRRRKDVAWGKNTRGYDRYRELIPKHERKGYIEHPRTPDITEKMSKRRWDGMIKVWRRTLHNWDPPEDEDDKDLADLLNSTTKFVDNKEKQEILVTTKSEKENEKDVDDSDHDSDADLL